MAINPFPALLLVLLNQVGGMPRVASRSDGPCDPRAPVQSLWGPGLGFPLRSPGLPWVVSTIRPNAGPCREGGLSSTDERVRGPVIEVT